MAMFVYAAKSDFFFVTLVNMRAHTGSSHVVSSLLEPQIHVHVHVPGCKGSRDYA